MLQPTVVGVFACVIRPFACARESLVLALGRRSAELVPRCSRRINHRPSLADYSPLLRQHHIQTTPPSTPPASQPSRTQDRVLQLNRELICALPNFGIVQRCAPSLVASYSPLHHPARARRYPPSSPLSYPCAYRSAQPSEYLQRLTATGARISRSYDLIQRWLCDEPVPTLRAQCQAAGCNAGRVASELRSIIYFTRRSGNGRLGHDQSSSFECAW